MRARITAAFALLVASALAGSGLLVYVIETQRLEEQQVREVDQEFAEFRALQELGIDPATRETFSALGPLLRTFMERNVPDDDELLVGWVGGEPVHWFPDDGLVDDDTFRDTAAPLVTDGGSTRLQTAQGEVLISSQPLAQGEQTGALLVVIYLDEDRAEITDTMRTYAIVAALSLLLVVAVAYWQAGRLLAPLRVVRQTADEITETDLSRRLPLTGNDDITDLTRTVNGMLDRLEDAFVGQRQFLDDAGHELRTPLTVLRGHLELLDTGTPEEVAETKDLLLDEVDRMARLVGDLILLAKSDRPDFVRPAPVDLGGLTEDLLDKARGLADRDWVLDDLAEGGAELDGQRVTQAVLQLADNAVKHTGAGDEIGIGSALVPDGVWFWVRDTGPGIPPEHRDLVFERFGRSAVRADDEGFGLGLSIVRAIALAHGGQVGVRDVDPHGTHVDLVLPLRRPPGSEGDDAWPAS